MIDSCLYKRIIFHIDVNSAFLSWEASRRVARGEKDIRDIPSCVGGNPKSRTGIVVAKSIPAKKYGIETGEPVSSALRKCPNLLIVPADFDFYMQCSRGFKNICNMYTPAMESFSIDEVFMDMSGMKNIYPDIEKTAYEIKDKIKNELGFTVNVGIGENKLCAKMASDFEKPDKVHTLMMNEIPLKMWPLPINDLFTCGKASAEKLCSIGLKTIGDVAHSSEMSLIKILGESQGRHLYRFASGIDNSPVLAHKEEAKGYSIETTVEDDLTDIDEICKMLLAQADIVCARMRSENAKCRCVAVSYRTTDFKNKTHQKKLEETTDVTDFVYEVAKKLIVEVWKREPLRLIGLALSDVVRDDYEQISFIIDEKAEKLKKLDSALDSIRGRYGSDSIHRAGVTDIEGKISRGRRKQ